MYYIYQCKLFIDKLCLYNKSIHIDEFKLYLFHLPISKNMIIMKFGCDLLKIMRAFNKNRPSASRTRSVAVTYKQTNIHDESIRVLFFSMNPKNYRIKIVKINYNSSIFPTMLESTSTLTVCSRILRFY